MLYFRPRRQVHVPSDFVRGLFGGGRSVNG
jgi:hypothetical protein